jgi:hypothetical protein
MIRRDDSKEPTLPNLGDLGVQNDDIVFDPETLEGTLEDRASLMGPLVGRAGRLGRVGAARRCFTLASEGQPGRQG